MNAAATRSRFGTRRGGPKIPVADGRRQHLDWLGLVEVSGPFLTLPVLLRAWPELDAPDASTRPRFRAAHSAWQADPEAGQESWIGYVLHDWLGWGDELHTSAEALTPLAVEVREHDTTLVPSFALTDSGDKPEDGARLLGLVFPPNTPPHGRPRVRQDADTEASAWSATPVDRMALVLRQRGVELGVVTDGRFWTLVWAPPRGVTTSAVFDAISWPETGDKVLRHAFYSLLRRRRFFGVDEKEQLLTLLQDSTEDQEEITEPLGIQVRKAVELLVDAFGRAEPRLRAERGVDLAGVSSAFDVYRGAVAVMMRIVFLLFAEERSLLPADNDLYGEMYSVGRLFRQLQARLEEPDVTEDELEHSTAAWHRLIALFRAVHSGVDHDELKLPAYDGSIFDPDAFPWLEGRLRPEDDVDPSVAPLAIDDRTVYHMLKSVQYVEIGSRKANKEQRRLSFRTLDVEQIGYVYEGLLSFEGKRALDTVVGLIGGEGIEEEVDLSTLEQMARAASHGGELDVEAFAAALAERYKDSKIGSAKKLAAALTLKTAGDRVEADRQLQAVTGDAELARKLLPFYGIIRKDLRGLPVVIKAGGLYVTESALRKNTGTHYTPRFLAEQVANGALEPLVYSPGPLQTADRDEWKLRSADEILALRVADIAMGSAAFLVAACRYLSARLVEAWAREGGEDAAKAADDSEARVVDVESDPVMIEARRQVIEHCLYGVDINPMAVEMAKLSLWLVSMDPHRPFTFLDDRLVAGDSLLGITSIEQLEAMDLSPARGRTALGSEHVEIPTLSSVRGLMAELVAKRTEIGEVDGDSLEHMERKREILAEVREHTATAEFVADLVVGAALATAGKADAVQRNARFLSMQRADGIGRGEDEQAVPAARELAQKWLDTDLPDGGFDRDPLHWPLVFPEVFERGGFDAVIGNPPFLGGQKLTGSLGTAYREYLVEDLAKGARGSADLVAYMLLRAHQILNDGGQTGLVATNTLAQGDTREVGLDQVVADGTEIRIAVKSKPWPSSGAVLEYCAVWTTKAPMDEQAERIADGVTVGLIAATLDAQSRIDWVPERLKANADIAFQGSIVLGLGFTMEPDEAAAIIERDSRNREILFPYINGEDLNSRPDSSGSRWVINFHDWTEEKAATYSEPFDRLRRLVKPERDKNNRAVYRQKWWQYAERRPAMLRAIAGLDRVIAITRVSKVVMPVMVPTGRVFSEQVVVFASDDTALLAFLSSAPHYWCAISRASTMKGDLRYTPTDVFDSLPRPDLTQDLRDLGDRLDTFRRTLMLDRNLGLTKTYNLVHDPEATSPDHADIETLREIHRDIDYAVARAYGWDDLAQPSALDHGFHDTRQGVRYTVGPAVRQDILDQLLELNRDRYLAEQAGSAEQEGLF